MMWEEHRRETMNTRLLLPLLGFLISFAFPIYAQQKDLADPQTTHKILAIAKAYNKGVNNTDPGAIAALFTDDAVFVADTGTMTGRPAIQKWYTDLFQRWHPQNHACRIDGNAPHLIGGSGNELWATGEWNEIGQGKNGEPLPIGGYWACIYVREGDDWKNRMCASITSPDSIIRIHQSFAPEAAATPSPTASPSTQ